jgi:tetratricopeptide (TPR) repeat protein
MRYLVFSFSLLVLFSCGQRQTPAETSDMRSSTGQCGPALTGAYLTEKQAPVFSGLEYFSFPITSNSAEAQKYFTQGWALAAGFNHAEAARSFYWATKEDPECAMCYWGLAYVLGPNYNAGMDPEVVNDAIGAIQQAQLLATSCTERERDLINAMASRYPPEISEDRSRHDEAYSEALGKLVEKYPEDNDIAALYAESIMDLHPWDLWDKDGTPKEWTTEIISTLEGILARDPGHVIAKHLYIHAVEASHSPEDGTSVAQSLEGQVPGAGHLVHMPTHIYIRTGDYHRCTELNVQAVEVDSVYVSACHASGAYPLGYYPHNFHFICACAALEGKGRLALEGAWRMQEKLDTVIMREEGWGTVQHYYTIPYYIMVKFAMWDEILDTPLPAADLKYPNAVLHYARGLAYAGKGEFGQARKALQSVRALATAEEIQSMTIWEINTVSDLIAIAEKVLNAEILIAEGHPEQAIPILEGAVAIEDGLNYNEPPDWFFSVRHHLGHALLSMGNWVEAQSVYERDLFYFPENGWALNGLYEALQKQGKTAEASAVKERLDQAWQWANVKLQGSKVL